MLFCTQIFEGMLRLVVSLVVISIMNGGVISHPATGSSNVTRIFQWHIEVFDMVDQYRNLNTTRDSIEKVLRKMNKLALILDSVTMKMNLQCGNIIELLNTNNVREWIVLENSELCDHIQRVDRFFKESKKYDYGKSFSNETLITFGHEVLWGDTNLPDELENIHESFVSIVYSSELSPAHRAILNIIDDCDTHMSAQQRIYYIYIQLMISEMKGLIALERIYLTKRLMSKTGDTYIAELDLARQRCKSRLTDYYNLLILAITISPQHIRRCDIKKPERGIDIIELRGFSQVRLLNKKFLKESKCKGCPNRSELQKISAHLDTTIYNCKNLGRAVETCPAKRRSYRNYLWWQDDNGNHYGHREFCNRTYFVEGQWEPIKYFRLLPTGGVRCDVCACSMDLNRARKVNTHTIWRISITEQVSDVFNNMVVTGVRFVTDKNALHIQIHQSNFSHNGLVHNHGGWKKLDIGISDRDTKLTNMPMHYVPLKHNRKTLYLDDINVPEGHVVAGIRFHLEQDSAFKLQVLAKPFELKTGKVDPFRGDWLDAPNNPVRFKDYERKRIAIELDNSDDPTRNVEFQYDLESNKMVDFTHTDIYKDAGQTTIPLFHAKPVMTRPPFPLSAIGLSYRGREGFSGYIAPRIYTLDTSNYVTSLETSINDRILIDLIDKNDLAQIENIRYITSR